MKGFKIIFIICLITLMTCNRDGFQDFNDNITKTVRNLRDDESEYSFDYEAWIRDKFEDFIESIKELFFGRTWNYNDFYPG